MALVLCDADAASALAKAVAGRTNLNWIRFMGVSPPLWHGLLAAAASLVDLSYFEVRRARGGGDFHVDADTVAKAIRASKCRMIIHAADTGKGWVDETEMGSI